MTTHLSVLLFEPQSLLRQTVALTLRSIGIGPVYQAASVQMAQRMVNDQPFGAVIVSLDGDEVSSSAAQAIELINAIRSGNTPSEESLPVVVTTTACNRAVLENLSDLGVRKILIKPFKARLLIDAMTEIAEVGVGVDRRIAVV